MILETQAQTPLWLSLFSSSKNFNRKPSSSFAHPILQYIAKTSPILVGAVK